jgi:hypothetical protein
MRLVGTVTKVDEHSISRRLVAGMSQGSHATRENDEEEENLRSSPESH